MNKITNLSVPLLCAVIVSTCGATVQAQTVEQIVKGNTKVCASVCEDTLNYATQQKGRHAEQTVTDALKDCISACKMATDFLARNSRLESKVAAIAVDACTHAAKTCESFKNDKTMNATANECRKTAGNLSKIVNRTTASK